jgi:hypothetical protein
MTALNRLLAMGQRFARPDDGPLLLWNSHQEMLQQVRATGDGLPAQLHSQDKHELWLRLLGVDILVRCVHETAANQIGQYFARSVRIRPLRSPDCIVECDWPEAGRYLFRARPRHLPEILDGVRFQISGDPQPLPWRSHHPPIPPIGSRILMDRFAGLHAAAAVHPEGAVVIFAGERKSGKSTTALNLTRRYGWSLLTDETVFLLRRTQVVEPFPRSIGVAAQIDHQSGTPVSKDFVPVDDVIKRVATEPALATRVVILEPDGSVSDPELAVVPPSTALAHLLPHNLDVGISADESFVTMLQLTEKCPAAIYRYREPVDLLRLPRELEHTWRIPAFPDATWPSESAPADEPATHDMLFQLKEGSVTP